MYGGKNARHRHKRLLQKTGNDTIQYNFDDEQNDRIGVLLGSINNLRDVWGESRKYRRRTLISNDISQRQIILVFTEIENSGFTQKILRDKNKNT